MDLYKRVHARVDKLRASSRWYEIRNAASSKATVRIYDEIGYWGVTADDFAADLESITAPEIEVQINSPGGEVFAGVAIFNSLRSHPARVTTRVDGIAASIASVIAQAGDHRVMLSGSQMMIHSAWGLCVGSADEMREMADLLDRQSDVLASIYAERSGGDKAMFRERLAKDTWLTAAEAVELGLADEVVEPERKDAQPSGLTEDRVRSLIAEGIAVHQIASPAPAVEVDTPPSGERVDRETADRLLASITFTKENNQ